MRRRTALATVRGALRSTHAPPVACAELGGRRPPPRAGAIGGSGAPLLPIRWVIPWGTPRCLPWRGER
eukprot:602623-Alexandrium_andersonii.AAC.1